MSYITDFKDTEKVNTYELCFGDYKNLSTGIIINDLVNTNAIVSVDLHEFRYRPDPAEIPAQLDIIRLQWSNYATTSSGFYTVDLFPQRLNDNSYVAEFNSPINLFTLQSAKIRESGSFFLLKFFKLFNNRELNTSSYQLRLTIKSATIQGMKTLPQFENKILGAY